MNFESLFYILLYIYYIDGRRWVDRVKWCGAKEWQTEEVEDRITIEVTNTKCAGVASTVGME